MSLDWFRLGLAGHESLDALVDHLCVSAIGELGQTLRRRRQILGEAGSSKRQLMLERLFYELVLADVLLGGNLAQQRPDARVPEAERKGWRDTPLGHTGHGPMIPL